MHINIFKNKIFLYILSILVISSCQTANKAEKESVDDKKVIIDLKTTRDSSPESFRRSAYNYGYDRQAAFYLDGFKADEFWFLVIEKESPYRVGIYKASDEFIEGGRQKNQSLLKKYKEFFIKKVKDINKFYFKGEL